MHAHKPLVYVSRLLPEPVMAAIRDRYELVREPTDSQAAEAHVREGLMQADAAIVTLSDRIDADAIHHTTRLKILANYAVGYNNIDVAAANRRGLIVTNTPDVLTDATADLTWALILATARRIVEGDQLVRSGRWGGWAPTQLLGAAVAEKTLGIVGMGRIGQAVARRASGFRMKILSHARRPVTSAPESAAWESATLPDLLAQSDFVTLHVPLTSETTHLIGTAELSRMKRTAVLINTARGPIVDEAALVKALHEGLIAGAGLDVYEHEPAVHPELPAMKQVVLLPHLGSATMSARLQMGMICIRNVDEVLAGRPAPNRVGVPAQVA